jgi:hypothetical protein
MWKYIHPFQTQILWKHTELQHLLTTLYTYYYPTGYVLLKLSYLLQTKSNTKAMLQTNTKETDLMCVEPTFNRANSKRNIEASHTAYTISSQTAPKEY